MKQDIVHGPLVTKSRCEQALDGAEMHKSRDELKDALEFETALLADKTFTPQKKRCVLDQVLADIWREVSPL